LYAAVRGEGGVGGHMRGLVPFVLFFTQRRGDAEVLGGESSRLRGPLLAVFFCTRRRKGAEVRAAKSLVSLAKVRAHWERAP